MKVAIIHLSDFHVKSGQRFSNTKLGGFIDSLNIIRDVDEYIIVFSGDLAYSGQINEYKSSRYIFGKIISALKEKNKNKFVQLLLTPGNHDLCLPIKTRERADIQSYYDTGTIETNLQNEFKFLENYYQHSNANWHTPYDKILQRSFHTFGEYKIQFNIINTAPFSTLKPDDKELHFFPKEKLYMLKKSEDANLCITIMHHSPEWFYWSCKSDLEKTIIDNSEILMTGHDHHEKTSTVSINNSMDTWVSAAGEMSFNSIDVEDSFNVIVVDTERNSFDGYIFSWKSNDKIYMHQIICKDKTLQNHTAQMLPLPSYIKILKEDNYNQSEDFTKYFVFPRFKSEYKNENGKYDEIKSIDDFKIFLDKRKNISIVGPENAGKSTVLKSIYLSLLGNKVPLLLSIENKTKINPNNFIKHLFEDQYGNDPAAFERYQQLDKRKRILLIDNWDLIKPSNNVSQLSETISNFFEFVIYTCSSKKENIIDEIKQEITEAFPVCQIVIKPFFAEKRRELIENIYSYNNLNVNDASNVNKIVDSLVKNNSGLFQLNPAFLIRYTNFFLRDPYYDYTKGEAAFSKVFEFELQQNIINIVKRSDVDETLIAFEEIAGYMYVNRKDILKIEEVRDIIDSYCEIYGVSINVKNIIETGIRAKLFKQTDDYEIYFISKNQLAYFIAKYLIRLSQSEPFDNTGIIYALKNICFGINSDVILFISYLSSNTQILMSIVEHAEELLAPWKALELTNNNLTLFKSNESLIIDSPTAEEQADYLVKKEIREEAQYPNSTIEAIGMFDYDDNEIDNYQFRLIRAIKYTEMICKALPAFHSQLKVPQKEEIVKAIYSYPRKISYALLRPIDIHTDDICEEILTFLNNTTNKNISKEITIKDIKAMITDYSRATFLSMTDHFTEICTSAKTFPLLMNNEVADASELIENLLIIENNGDSDLLLKNAMSIIKGRHSSEVILMAKLVVRKHILTNPEMPFNKKQQLIDKIFGKENRKMFLPK